MKRTLVTAALGAGAMYLLDPQHGRTRRAKLQDQLGALFRQGAREASRKSEYVGGRMEGLRHAVSEVGSSDAPPASDETLTAKIESEVLSRADYPKGSINVNTVEGIVEVRGTCETQKQITELEQQVRKISGVVDVRNYLHLPNTPAPNKK